MNFDINPLSPSWQGATFAAFVGMLGLMALDVIIGTLVAFAQHRASSAINRQGIVEKVVAILLVAATGMGKIVLVQIHPGFRNVPIIFMVAAGFAASEMISIMEYAAKAKAENRFFVWFARFFAQAVAAQPVPGIPVVPVTPVQARADGETMVASWVGAGATAPPSAPTKTLAETIETQGPASDE